MMQFARRQELLYRVRIIAWPNQPSDLGIRDVLGEYEIREKQYVEIAV